MIGIFKFIARNPPMALIVGGMMFILLNNNSGYWFMGIGIALHLLWLRRRGN